MGKYGVNFEQFTTGTGITTALALDANAAAEEFELIEFAMTGSKAAAADRQHECYLARCTFATAGTGTARVPVPFNERDSATLILSTIEFTVEPTVVDTIYPVNFGFNQRGGMRWAVPQGEGLKCHNANTKRGAVLQVSSDAAGEVTGYGNFWSPA